MVKEIDRILTNNPYDGAPDVIVATLSHKFPNLRQVTKASLRYYLDKVKKKYIPNDGKAIDPLLVKTIRGNKFGREYIINDSGDFFIMYSEFEEYFIEKCKEDTTQLMVDGTFKCVPPEYSQLLVVVLFSYNKDFFMPIFFCFMPNKDIAAYTFILKKVKSLLLKHSVKPKYVTCDFEKALMKSLTVVFTESRYVACFFHFTHCLTTKCRHMALYKDEYAKVTKSMLSELKGLPFIPSNQIEKKFAEIHSKYCSINEAYARFLKYFSKHFITGQFSVSNWSYYHMINELDPRYRIVLTNIPVESFNSRLNISLHSINPTCFDAIQAIKKVECMRQYHFEEYLAGNKIYNTHKSKYEHYIKVARQKYGEYKYFEYNDETFNDINGHEFEEYNKNDSINFDKELIIKEHSKNQVLRKKYKINNPMKDSKRKCKTSAWNIWTPIAKIRASIERSIVY